jgi:hypothetical protein
VSPLEKLFRLELEFHRRLRTQAPGTSPVADKEVRYCMARAFQQWSLEQRPDPGALDGYEIDVDYKQILIDTEKAKTAWERIIAMRLLNHESPALILPILASIDDQHEKAQAIKSLMHR